MVGDQNHRARFRRRFAHCTRCSLHTRAKDLNFKKDLVADWEQPIFRHVWARLTKRTFPSKPKAIDIALMVEFLEAGWGLIREEGLPVLQAVQVAADGGRVDANALIYMLETRLPLACYNYSVVFRQHVRAEAAREQNMYLHGLQYMLCDAVCRQRKVAK